MKSFNKILKRLLIVGISLIGQQIFVPSMDQARSSEDTKSGAAAECSPSQCGRFVKANRVMNFKLL